MPSNRHIIDETDRIVLKSLQDEGRLTNVDLAARAGLTAPPTLRRVRALETAGIIRGYHADLNPEALGYSIMVFAMVSLKSQAENDLRAFEEHVAQLPPVRECHMLNGEIDFILKIVAHDLQEFQRFLTAHLTSAPNVEHVKTSLTIRTSKNQPGIPVDDA
ncbi:Lrp/AsnC family transcriptional regulator [Sphingosinicella sp.]|jgi:DNA-binding Lrp family transcriptional regulator|uniref:Lrp/AsnC family transcriptional regulator n=1 Tax=Sphingosinicella xenopeptidilytica TaxID=364098 RepID=A0ABW3C937_SPHXN|nr:Lrp/AsnC family transcriptional regulator [Sphingosinicella sp.]MBA4758803.1 Lrp/AsnC family transcriptional regulator [Sphingosinicella sp.]MBL8648160.1 Lrp/AsnC family transcriptional regulator [Sphingosinicella sp.]MEA3538725.1 Lrp/AsnC family transcriptional regulator [Pseudomonadota bacterium]|tara:strand:- start:4265 stop:4747 length:483 start_codon:yes stop_codon:yes gene_type:complete